MAEIGSGFLTYEVPPIPRLKSGFSLRFVGYVDSGRNKK